MRLTPAPAEALPLRRGHPAARQPPPRSPRRGRPLPPARPPVACLQRRPRAPRPPAPRWPTQPPFARRPPTAARAPPPSCTPHTPFPPRAAPLHPQSRSSAPWRLQRAHRWSVWKMGEGDALFRGKDVSRPTQALAAHLPPPVQRTQPSKSPAASRPAARRRAPFSARTLKKAQTAAASIARAQDKQTATGERPPTRGPASALLRVMRGGARGAQLRRARRRGRVYLLGYVACRRSVCMHARFAGALLPRAPFLRRARARLEAARGWAREGSTVTLGSLMEGCAL